MKSNAVGSIDALAIKTETVHKPTEIRPIAEVIPLHPGVGEANALDTARAEVNAAQFMTAMMQPSPDGIYAIGAVAAKFGSIVNAVKAVAKAPWSFWGF